MKARQKLILAIIAVFVSLSGILLTDTVEWRIMKAKSLKPTDRIIIYRLNGEESQRTIGKFSIGKNNVYQIYGQEALQGKVRDDFITAWKNFPTNNGTGYFCHYATYGIQIIRGSRERFRCTVCWTCENISFETYFSDSNLVGFTGVDDNTKVLHDILDEELPYKRDFWRLRKQEIERMISEGEL